MCLMLIPMNHNIQRYSKQARSFISAATQYSGDLDEWVFNSTRTRKPRDQNSKRYNPKELQKLIGRIELGKKLAARDRWSKRKESKEKDREKEERRDKDKGS